MLFATAFPQTDSESDMSSLERSAAMRSPVSRRRVLNVRNGPRVTSPQMGRRALSPMYTRSEASSTPERKSNSLPRIVLNRVNADLENGTGSATSIMRSETPSEGSESAGDEGKRLNADVKRNRSLRALRRKKGEDEEQSLLERFKNSVTTNDPDKQRRKSMKRKQKEEVGS